MPFILKRTKQISKSNHYQELEIPWQGRCINSSTVINVQGHQTICSARTKLSSELTSHYATNKVMS